MMLNCESKYGDTISFRDLSPVVVLNVTVDFKRGGKISKMIDLMKIGKSFLKWKHSRCVFRLILNM